MKLRQSLLSLCFLAFFLVVGKTEAMASEKITYTGPPVTIRFSGYYAPEYPVFKIGISPWMKMVEKESQGKILFQEYLSGVLHSARDGFKAMRSDIADITTGYPSYQAGSFHLCHGAELPFAFPNAYVGNAVMEELYPKYLKKEYESLEVYLAFYTNTSSYNLISKKPIRKFEDFKGMKIRSPGGTSSALLKKFEAAPVVVQAAEAYTSFQRGIIDGVLLPDNSMASFHLQEVGKYLTPLGMIQVGIAYCMNRKTFDGIPKELKPFFYRMLRIGGQFSSGAYEKSDGAAREEMAKSGLTINQLPPEEVQKCRKAVEPLWEEFITSNEKLGLPAKSFVKDLRSLSEKYSTWTPEQIMKKVTEQPVQGIIDF